MSDFIQAFEECLNSNFSCDDILLKLQNLSSYSINQKIGEAEVINKFMEFSTKHFLNELLSVEINIKDGNFIAQSKDLFNISHMIITNKEKYKNNINYEKIELFYHTFFFSEFSEENETNDFTFFYKLSDDYTDAKKVELYLFNIGLIILSEEIDFKSKLIEALFSKDTPDFLTNIILICFEYIRYKKQDISYFIQFCTPYLNHFNLYYLSQILNKDCNYKSYDIRNLFYLHFEKNINNLTKYNIIDEESKVNYIKIEKNEVIDTINTSKEEIEKYFNIPNLQEMKDLYFVIKDNIKENNEKFLNIFKLKDGQMKYKIVYDKLEINDETINAFSFIYLLKFNQIQKIDEHFFQIYNKGNLKIEIFSNLLSKYMIKINQFLEGKLKNEEKEILFQNSGFYKFKNEYIFLIYIDEEELKLFYLKNGLRQVNITSLNKDNNFMTFQICQSEKSSTDESNYFYQDNDIDDELLYTFGNYSFENDIRCYIKHFINNNTKIYELPRLYFLLNYCIPLPNNEYKFITNVRSKIKENSSYGYCELDFVLKNESNDDIIIEFDNPPYREKLMMNFPKEIKEDNNQKIILKKNSIIFFEFKSSFPQFNWKDKFNLIFKKVENFLEIYKSRGVYKKEYIQIFFVYDSMPEIYYLKYMKSYINKHFGFMFTNFEFGIFYFSKGINILNNQIIQKQLSDMQSTIKEIQKELKEMKEKK